jgi:hypothetical protein
MSINGPRESDRKPCSASILTRARSAGRIFFHHGAILTTWQRVYNGDRCRPAPIGMVQYMGGGPMRSDEQFFTVGLLWADVFL